MGLVQQIAQATGISPEQIVQFVMQKAAETGQHPMQILQQLAQEVLGGNAPMTPDQTAQQGPQVMSSPNTRALGRNARVGPTVRPSGIATGRAPAARRTGDERP